MPNPIQVYDSIVASIKKDADLLDPEKAIRQLSDEEVKIISERIARKNRQLETQGKLVDEYRRNLGNIQHNNS